MTNPKTVRVRIAVAVDAEGNYSAYHRHPYDHENSAVQVECMMQNYPSAHVVWVTADVPLPHAAEIEGEAEA